MYVSLYDIRHDTVHAYVIVQFVYRLLGTRGITDFYFIIVKQSKKYICGGFSQIRSHNYIDVDLFKECYAFSVLDLHVGEINVLSRPVSHFFYY